MLNLISKSNINTNPRAYAGTLFDDLCWQTLNHETYLNPEP